MDKPKFVSKYRLLSPEVPIAFADGTNIYEELSRTYIRHDRGLFILAPSGAGKSHFVRSQRENHWIDGDDLWQITNAHPDGEWWLEGLEKIFEVERRSDIITEQAKKLGFWIVGASNHWLRPDAVVIPHWATHKKWIAAREKGDYDGGATSDMLGQVLNHRKVIRQWVKQGVPSFGSVSEATAHLTN